MHQAHDSSCLINERKGHCLLHQNILTQLVLLFALLQNSTLPGYYKRERYEDIFISLARLDLIHLNRMGVI